MTEQEPDPQLKDFRSSVVQTLCKSQDDFEKQLVYVSSGGLLASVFFIEKIIKDVHKADHKWLLVCSWFFLGLTLLVNLISHYNSANYQIRTLEELNNNCYDYERADKRNKKIDWMNIATLGSLAIGVILLLLFITINL